MTCPALELWKERDILIEQGEAIADLVRGKTISLVGPAAYMVGSGFGQEIDSADLVVRLNDAITHYPYVELEQDIGSRFDMLYMAPIMLTTTYREYFDGKKTEQNPVEKIKKAGIKTVRAMPYKWIRLNSFKISLEAVGVVLLDSSSINEKVRSHLKGFQPRVGFLALLDLFLHGAKMVKIFGFTFYHGGGNIFRPDPGGELSPIASHNLGPTSHDSVKELALLKALVKLLDIKGQPDLLAFDSRFEELVR